MPHFSASLRRFSSDRRASTATVFALCLIPVMFSAGMAIDYSNTALVRTQLQAAADAAVLAGTTPQMMNQSAATAKATIVRQFGAQAQRISGFTYDAGSLVVSVSPDNAPQRSVTLQYNASVTNAFGQLYGSNTTALKVSSASSSKRAPNIDFYFLLDNSPSMELPASTFGLNAMSAATGCEFACHTKETQNFPGYGVMDSYTYAQRAGILLRIDNVRSATSSLATVANETMAKNNAIYRAAAYGFNFDIQNVQPLVTLSTGNISSFKTNVDKLIPPLMESNQVLAPGQSFSYPVGGGNYNKTILSSPLYIGDAMTDFNLALTTMNKTIPNPGQGSNTLGDTPQAVLMLVTDGVGDRAVLTSGECGTNFSYYFTNQFGAFYRCQEPINPALCSAIKSRGVKIAVLNTVYFPLNNGWYIDTIAPFMPQAQANLKSCATDATLYFEVQNGGDITAAMQSLFAKAVESVNRLTQ